MAANGARGMVVRKKFKCFKCSGKLDLSSASSDIECIKQILHCVQDGLEEIDPLKPPLNPTSSPRWRLSDFYQKLACNHRLIFSHNRLFDYIVLISLTPYP